MRKVNNMQIFMMHLGNMNYCYFINKSGGQSVEINYRELFITVHFNML